MPFVTSTRLSSDSLVALHISRVIVIGLYSCFLNAIEAGGGLYCRLLGYLVFGHIMSHFWSSNVVDLFTVNRDSFLILLEAFPHQILLILHSNARVVIHSGYLH